MRTAQPIDRSVQTDERRRTHVPDDAVILDRLVTHRSASFPRRGMPVSVRWTNQRRPAGDVRWGRLLGFRHQYNHRVVYPPLANIV